MTVAADAPGAQTFRNRLSSPALLKAYMAAKMPLGALAGLRVEALDGDRCAVSVPYSWRTKNPFGSIYFAALSMAAELSCACLALQAARAPHEKVAVYPIALKGDFLKQAKAKTTFTCTQGPELFDAVRRAVETREAITVVTSTVGQTDEGLIVSRFDFTWSYKKK
jgi:acyl-coenzyme A thioesterase PaaI-like protein